MNRLKTQSGDGFRSRIPRPPLPRAAVWMVFAFFLLSFLLSCAMAQEVRESADAILTGPGVRRGLTVVLGSEPGLAAAIHEHTGLPVQCLTLEQNELLKTRALLHERGVHGPVSAALWRGRPKLPYSDNMVMLIVLSETEDWMEQGLSPDELQRVLAPYGTIAFRPRDGEDMGMESVSADAGWALFAKPYPEDMDVWSQYGYDAAGSMRSGDSAAGPVQSLRWVAGKHWDGAMNQPSQIISSGGRVFYVDTNPQGTRADQRPPRIEARDAFTGLKLWERRIAADWRPLPVAMALGERVFVPLRETGGNLAALDGDTGELLWQYDFGGSEIKYHDGVFLSHGGQKAWDAESGELLWETQVGEYPDRAMGHDPFHLHLAAGDMVCVIDEGDYARRRRMAREELETGTLIGRGLRDGQVRWKTPLQGHELLITADDSRILTMDIGSMTDDRPDRRILRAYAAADGRPVWAFDFDAVYKTRVMAVIAGGEVFLHARRSFPGQRRPSNVIVALDADTGDELRAWRYGGQWISRCHPRRSTPDYLLLPDGSLVETETEQLHITRAFRGACRFGYVPANGLLYKDLNKCMCFNSVRGRAAFSPEETFLGDPQILFETGPSYDQFEAGAGSRPGDWPMHRGDMRRHGSTRERTPGELEPAWSVALSAPATAPTVAGHQVFSAIPRENRVLALDRENGDILWHYTAEGRVDSPPTYWNGILLFGCAGGWVYALDASDGTLIWRLRAAPAERWIVARGGMESLWPLHGSVLVVEGVAYVAAGRHIDIDGGIFFHAVDPLSGEILWSKRIGSDQEDLARIRRGMSANPTLLQSDGRLLYMDNDLRLDRATGEYQPLSPEQREDEENVESSVMWGGALGFLNKEVLEGWLSGQSGGRKNWRYRRYDGDILAVGDDGAVFGVAHRGTHHGDHTWRRRLRGWGGEAQGRLDVDGPAIFASRKAEEPWIVEIPDGVFRIKAVIASPTHLYCAVAPDMNDPEKGELWVLSVRDGERIATYDLGAQPRFDALAVTGTGVFISTERGQVIHLTGRD